VNVRIEAAAALKGADRDRWIELVVANPELDSPYFRPEFTEAVAAERDDARVGVLEEAGEAIGFFPFQCRRRPVGVPIGGRLSDFHAVIAAPGAIFDAVTLIRGCRLAIFDFDHLLASQEPFADHRKRLARSPVMDLSAGFDAYCKARQGYGSRRIRQVQRKGRKIERELGDLRLEADITDPRVLERVIEWKSEQCRRTGKFDFFRQTWARGLVERIAATRSEAFSGIVSALYRGDRVIAAHMGMRTRNVFHWWFPVYDHAFGKYSPGAILLLRLAEWAASQGIARIDLGKGDDSYKASFMTDVVPLAEGSVILRSITGALRYTRTATEAFLRRSPLAAPIRGPVRRLRHGIEHRSGPR